MATPAPNPIDDFTDVQFKRHNISQLFDGSPDQFNQCSLLATASLYGLIVAGSAQRELYVLHLGDVVASSGDQIVARTIGLPQPARAIALSCDHSMLAVNYTQNGSTFLTVYAVSSLMASNVVILHQNIVLSPDLNVAVRELLWNPVMPNTLAVCLDNGSLCVLNFGANAAGGYELHTLPKAEQAQCASWSPKGKQIVVGFPQGKLAQYKPDLQLARTIPCPEAVYSGGGAFDIITVQWLSTYQFAAALQRRKVGECPAVFIVNAPKATPPTYINYEDICYSQSGPRVAQVFFQHILPWNLLLVGSANSMEIGVLGTREAGETPLWTQYTMGDESRAEVPLTADRQESYPIGVAVETGCTHWLTENEQRLPMVMPMLHVLSTGGQLASFDLVNRLAGVPTLCQAPKSVPDVSGAGEFRKIVPSVPTVAAPAAVAATTNINDMTFMVPGNAATSTPAVAQKTKPSMFGGGFGDAKPAGVNLFGAAPAPDATSAAGKAAPPPSFGLQSSGGAPMFGGAPMTAATGGFGMAPAPAPVQTSAAPSQPAFGGFGGIGGGSTTSSPFASSNFGSVKPAAAAPTFGGLGTSIGGIGQPPQFGAVDFQANTSGPVPAPVATMNPNGSQPFLTVTNTYANPPSTPVVTHKTTNSAAGGGNNAGGGSVDDDKVIRKMIAEEIGSFEHDLARMLQRSRGLQIDLGSKDELAATAKQLAELQDISGQATETTDTLTLEIQSLRLALNEAFAMLTEAQTKQQMFGNMDVNTLRETSTMSQTNRRQMERLQSQMVINEHHLQVVNKQIDAHWSIHEQSVRHKAHAKMHIPQMENVYMTMSKQREILNTQKQRIAYIKSKIGYRTLPNGSGGGGGSSNAGTPLRSADANASVNSLSDSIFSMSLCDQVKLETERMSADKMAALRTVLQSRQTITMIRPQRPERKGLNSEVVLERKIAQQKKAQAASEPTPQPAAPPTAKLVPAGSRVKSAPAKTTPMSQQFAPAAVAKPAFGVQPASQAAMPTVVKPKASVAATPAPSMSFAFGGPDAGKSAFGTLPASKSDQPAPLAASAAPTTTFTYKPVASAPTVTAQKPLTSTAQPLSANSINSPALKFNSASTPTSSAFGQPPGKTLSFGSVASTPPSFAFGTGTATAAPTPFGGFTSAATPAPKSTANAAPTAAAPSAFSFAGLGSTNATSPQPAKPQTPTLNALLPKGIAAAAAASGPVDAPPPSAAAGPVADKSPTGVDKENEPISLVNKPPASNAFGSKQLGTATSIFGGATTITPNFGGVGGAAAATKPAFGGFGNAFGASLPAPATGAGAFSFGTSTTITAVPPEKVATVTATATTATAVVAPVAVAAAAAPTTGGLAAASSTAPTTTTPTPAATSAFTFSLSSTPATTATVTQPAAPSAAPATNGAAQPAVDNTDNLFQGLMVCQPNVAATAAAPAPAASGANIFASFGAPATATTSATTAPSTTSMFGSATAAAASSPFSTNLFGSVPPAANSSPAAGTATAASAFGSVFGAASTGNIFGSAAAPEQSVFGAATATTASAPLPAATNVFGVSIASPSSAGIFGGAVTAAPANGGSIFSGGAAATFGSPAAAGTAAAFGSMAVSGGGSGSMFGQSTFGQTPTNVFGQPAAAGAAPVAATGGSMFGGGSVFGGGGAAAAPAGGSIFGGASTGGTALAPSAFGGGNIFSSPAGAAAPSAFGAAPSIFSSPVAGGAAAASGGSLFGGGSAFGSPAGQPAAGAFGGAPAFGSAPSFGGAATFGSPKGGFGAFGQPAAGAAAAAPAFAAPTGQSNSLFESLGSSQSTGMTFGNIAQNTQPQGSGSAFGGGSSFSSWR